MKQPDYRQRRAAAAFDQSMFLKKIYEESAQTWVPLLVHLDQQTKE